MTPEEIARLVQEFEACTLSHDQWTHRAHLSVALWYLTRLPQDEATNTIRRRIQALNQALGVVDTPKSGYHETITLFYIRQISAYLRHRDQNTPLADLTDDLLAEWGDKNRIREYYSRGLLLSSAARTGWTEPDLCPL